VPCRKRIFLQVPENRKRVLTHTACCDGAASVKSGAVRMSHLAAGSRLAATSPAQLSGSCHHPAVLHASCRQHRARRPAASRTEARAVEQVTTDQLKQTHLITAIKTPYIDNGKFDLPAFDRLVEHQVMHAAVLCDRTLAVKQDRHTDRPRCMWRHKRGCPWQAAVVSRQ
jgi:hypothetical protein